MGKGSGGWYLVAACVAVGDPCHIQEFQRSGCCGAHGTSGEHVVIIRKSLTPLSNILRRVYLSSGKMPIDDGFLSDDIVRGSNGLREVS